MLDLSNFFKVLEDRGVGRLDIFDGYSMENFIADNISVEAAFIMEIEFL